MIDYKYKFPEHENNKDIFEKQNDYNVFIEASGFTYLGTYEEFGKNFPYNAITARIPMGYKAILVYERLNMIENGNIVWANKDMKALEREPLGDRKISYYIPSSIHKYLKHVFCIFDSTGYYYYGDAHCGFIENYEKAVEKAVELSKQSDLKFLICKVLGWEQWH